MIELKTPDDFRYRVTAARYGTVKNGSAWAQDPNTVFLQTENCGEVVITPQDRPHLWEQLTEFARLGDIAIDPHTPPEE